MPSDGVNLDPQGASNALAAWDTASGSLQQQYRAQAAKVLAALGNTGWIGEGDDASATFRESFKPDELSTFFALNGSGNAKSPNAADIVQGVVDLGTNTRTAINNSLGSDQQQKQEMDKPRKTLEA